MVNIDKDLYIRTKIYQKGNKDKYPNLRFFYHCAVIDYLNQKLKIQNNFNTENNQNYQ